MFLLTCCLMEVSSRPNNESTKIELPLDELQDENDNVERSITFTQESSVFPNSDNMRDIIEKIQAVNDGLKKPHKQHTHSYKAPPLPEGYVVDKELLEKIQQIIASGKIKTASEMKKHHDNNFINEDVDDNRKEHSKALQMLSSEINPQSMPFSPLPYIMNVPVVIMPYGNNNMKYPNTDFNSMQSIDNLQTRQGQPSPFPSFPSFGSNFQWPFQLQWPFANFFPLIIKDPFIALQQGGGWNNFFENGQTADVCARKQKNMKSMNNKISKNEDEIKSILKAIETITIDSIPKQNSPEREVDEDIDPVLDMNHRQDRALKKRTVASSAPSQEIESPRKTQNLYVAKPVVTRKPPKKIYIEAEVPEDTKTNAADGDLRFPFGGFDWFGNKKPVVPSPGFFINRLRVRKGGVAIAGPGGVATAGRGGTAIVGPGGLAYTQPGCLAVAGPAARVVALSSETDLNSVVTRLRQLNDTSLPLKQPIREGKVVATGPVIYYHPNEQTFSSEGFSQGSPSHSQPDIYQYDGEKFTEGFSMDTKYVLRLNPVAHAMSGTRGVAVANPESHVAIQRNNIGTVIHIPRATAVAGPGGIAHAQSDLYLYDYDTNANIGDGLRL